MDDVSTYGQRAFEVQVTIVFRIWDYLFFLLMRSSKTSHQTDTHRRTSTQLLRLFFSFKHKSPNLSRRDGGEYVSAWEEELNFRVRNKNKHSKRNPFLICLPKEDPYSMEHEQIPPIWSPGMKRNSETKDTYPVPSKVNK